jgi:uncharacterized protein (DUF433 family)
MPDIEELLDKYGLQYILDFFNLTEAQVLEALDETGYIDLSTLENENG